MGYKMKGSPHKLGTIQGTSGHKSALKQVEKTFDPNDPGNQLIKDESLQNKNTGFKDPELEKTSPNKGIGEFLKGLGSKIGIASKKHLAKVKASKIALEQDREKRRTIRKGGQGTREVVKETLTPELEKAKREKKIKKVTQRQQEKTTGKSERMISKIKKAKEEPKEGTWIGRTMRKAVGATEKGEKRRELRGEERKLKKDIRGARDAEERIAHKRENWKKVGYAVDEIFNKPQEETQSYKAYQKSGERKKTAWEEQRDAARIEAAKTKADLQRKIKFKQTAADIEKRRKNKIQTAKEAADIKPVSGE